MARSNLAKSQFWVIVTQAGCLKIWFLIRLPTKRAAEREYAAHSPAKVIVIEGNAPAVLLGFARVG